MDGSAHYQTYPRLKPKLCSYKVLSSFVEKYGRNRANSVAYIINTIL